MEALSAASKANCNVEGLNDKKYGSSHAATALHCLLIASVLWGTPEQRISIMPLADEQVGSMLKKTKRIKRPAIEYLSW
jgi:hypothetical protein